MSKNLKIYIYFLGLIGIFINGLYYYLSLSYIIHENLSQDTSAMSISSASLNFSWMILYIWFLKDPTQRSGILLISALTMLFSHGLSIFYLFKEFQILNSLPTMLITILFIYGYFLLKK